MRLGKDCLVFTKHLKSKSVGFLSQTYLAQTNATTVYVPMVTWDHNDNDILIIITSCCRYRIDTHFCSHFWKQKFSIQNSMELNFFEITSVKNE
jgi:hypothetical protein